jgi:hypothetical protein
MPEFWYDAPSDTRDMVARERALTSHGSMLGLAVLVFALFIAALIIARYVLAPRTRSGAPT